ncbi:MAG TPA: N-acetyltransferase [Bryobacteraceae bacterium]|jgi:amino-acid N-acetyltransferase|nr:N-acetyltransferase [Bryobacteraceae bacterium]
MISALTPDQVENQTASSRGIEVRKASMQDIPALLDLINGYAAKGIMLPRTEFEMSENMRDFMVAYAGNQLVGCGALHFYSPTVGEVRSLAVAESHKTHGIGRMVVDSLVYEAKLYGLDAVFAFTYVPRFFGKVGFHEVERGELPLKAWKDCLRCPKFECCDEIAVLRVLRQQRWQQRQQEMAPVIGVDNGLVVLLPTVRR